MLDKSNRKNYKTKRINTRNVGSSHSYDTNPCTQFLINYAIELINIQYDLSLKCEILHFNPKVFFVYSPDENIGSKSYLPPRKFRLRVVNFIEKKYLHCLCGFGSRNKTPYNHILSITKCYEPYIVSLRLLAPP